MPWPRCRRACARACSPARQSEVEPVAPAPARSAVFSPESHDAGCRGHGPQKQGAKCTGISCRLHEVRAVQQGRLLTSGSARSTCATMALGWRFSRWLSFMKCDDFGQLRVELQHGCCQLPCSCRARWALQIASSPDSCPAPGAQTHARWPLPSARPATAAEQAQKPELGCPTHQAPIVPVSQRRGCWAAGRVRHTACTARWLLLCRRRWSQKWSCL